MRIRKEYIVLVAVILGLSLYLWQYSADRVHYRLPELPSLSGEDITRVEIKGPEQTLHLRKDEGGWLVGAQGHRADRNKVRTLLDKLRSVELSALVSRSRNFKRYDLGGDQRIRVRAWQGEEPVRTLFVGKVAPNYSSTYVKLPGNPNVYLAQKNLRTALNKDAGDLRDKLVLSFDAGSIERIEAGGGNRTQVLERGASAANGTSWTWESGSGSADSSAQKLLRALENLRCANYLNPEQLTGAGEPAYTVLLAGKKEHSLSMYVKDTEEKGGKSEGRDYIVTSSGSPQPFELSDFKEKELVRALGGILGVKQDAGLKNAD